MYRSRASSPRHRLAFLTIKSTGDPSTTARKIHPAAHHRAFRQLGFANQLATFEFVGTGRVDAQHISFATGIKNYLIGGRMVKITDYDTALDPATAVAFINDAMREHAIILGPFASGIVSATMLRPISRNSSASRHFSASGNTVLFSQLR